MILVLDNSSQVPLYQQIVCQVRAAVLSGDLRPKDALPSIRQLAADLVTSVITTKRAYQELEAQGLIRTVPGRGTFVADLGDDFVQGLRLAETEAALRTLVRQALRLGLDRGTLTGLLARVLEEESEIS